jgi:serine/threonine-protein kinase RsbT
MSEANKALADLLRRYLSPINAQSILDRALREAQAAGVSTELAEITARVERSAKLFCSPQDFTKLSADLRALANQHGKARTRRVRVEILKEKDIVEALMVTRGLCQEVGARPLMQQRATTVVSELSRNIVAYTPGGHVELEVKSAPSRLSIRATDRGTGIPNLSEILAGKYRSRTGLGRGLLGTKQLAQRFDVSTGGGGTTIEAEIPL